MSNIFLKIEMSKMSCEEHKVFGPIEILFDFLKNRKYNDYKRVASKRKSSLPATRFHFAKMNIAMKKCVACQRKSSLYDKVRTFFVQKREELKQNGGKQQDEGDAGE